VFSSLLSSALQFLLQRIDTHRGFPHGRVKTSEWFSLPLVDTPEHALWQHLFGRASGPAETFKSLCLSRPRSTPGFELGACICWASALPLEPCHQPFCFYFSDRVLSFLWGPGLDSNPIWIVRMQVGTTMPSLLVVMGVSLTFSLDWPQTSTFLISFSWVAMITGMSHWAGQYLYIYICVCVCVCVSLHLQSRHSTTWATALVHFALVILEMGSREVFVWAGFEPQFSWSQPPK
jgi:hypothetical protein